jgi:hypothetical protein
MLLSRARRRIASDPPYFLAWTLVILAFALGPGVHSRLPALCPFLAATGLPCPGCGLSRSVGAAARLDFPAAFAFHAFGPVMLLGTVVALVAKPAGIRLSPWLAGLWARSRSGRAFGYVLAAAWMAWAIARAVTAARS